MVGRNDPCPCGSGKKYKKCCERVVAFRVAEQMREKRDRHWLAELLTDLNRWFSRHVPVPEQDRWADRFKRLLGFPEDQPIPKQFTFSFHYWLLFDAPCLDGKRPVERWITTVQKNPEKERVLKSFLEAELHCYEMVYIGEDYLLFRSLIDQQEYEVIRRDTIPREKIVFARLFRIGNRYEIFGPYTSFVHEMRGEILVQLEKYFLEDQHEDITRREHGWRVLGWSMQRARELETLENQAPAPADQIERLREALFWPEMEYQEEKPGLPLKIIQQLNQFYDSEVLPLQPRTQSLYSRSLDLLFQYLSLRFGQSFQWSLLTEDVLMHFFSVWYLDHAKATPVSSKIFLNTCKHLFRWLDKEEISDVYPVFQKVYLSLIRTLPMTIEARSWLKQHGVVQKKEKINGQIIHNMFMLAVAPSSPILLVENRWRPVQLRGFPSLWSDLRFWIRGTLVIDGQQCYFTQIDDVYPMVIPEDLASASINQK